MRNLALVALATLGLTAVIIFNKPAGNSVGEVPQEKPQLAAQPQAQPPSKAQIDYLIEDAL